MRMRHIVICVLPAFTIFFLHYLTKGTIFEKKMLFNIKYVLIFSRNLSETFLILRRTERDIIINVYWYSHKVQIFFSDFNETIIFSVDFLRNSNVRFNEISRVAAEVFDANGRTEGET
jgi:UDP-N-acetylglucosamine:LPS N-acetylglucosamine transferase